MNSIKWGPEPFLACYFFAIKREFNKMGTHFQKNSEIVANSKHFPSSFWKKLNVFLCNFFAIKWEFDKMGTFFRISCYFGAKWEPILSRAYCNSFVTEFIVHARVRAFSKLPLRPSIWFFFEVCVYQRWFGTYPCGLVPNGSPWWQFSDQRYDLEN